MNIIISEGEKMSIMVTRPSMPTIEEYIEEVKPILYFDETTNEVKGKCKLKAHRNYFAFEIRQGDDDDYILVGGSPVFKK